MAVVWDLEVARKSLKVKHLEGCPETGKGGKSPRVEFYAPILSPDAQKQPGNRERKPIALVGHCCQCGEMSYYTAELLLVAEAAAQVKEPV